MGEGRAAAVNIHEWPMAASRLFWSAAVSRYVMVGVARRAHLVPWQQSHRADAGDRTRASHQAGGCSSTELHPREGNTLPDRSTRGSQPRLAAAWRVRDVPFQLGIRHGRNATIRTPADASGGLVI